MQAFRYLFALGIVVALSACNQATDTQVAPTQTTTDTASTNAPSPTNDDSHAHHTPSMPMAEHSSEYMNAMGKMHHEMMNAAQKANADVAFVEGMIPHHQGAIDMATIELKYGQDPQIKKLAQDIITAQQKEIDLMQNWLKTANDKDQLNAQSEHAQAYMAGMSMHDAMMKGIHHENADVAFVLGMIPHHQGAIDMATIELKYGQDPQIKKLAQDIITAQEPEITLMKDWLKAQGITTP